MTRFIQPRSTWSCLLNVVFKHHQILRYENQVEWNVDILLSVKSRPTDVQPKTSDTSFTIKYIKVFQQKLYRPVELKPNQRMIILIILVNSIALVKFICLSVIESVDMVFVGWLMKIMYFLCDISVQYWSYLEFEYLSLWTHNRIPMFCIYVEN